MHSDLDISLFQVKNWEEILGEEFYMTNPLVRYILLAILLLVLFLRTLSWLQYLYLKRELKKRFTKQRGYFSIQVRSAECGIATAITQTNKKRYPTWATLFCYLIIFSPLKSLPETFWKTLSPNSGITANTWSNTSD